MLNEMICNYFENSDKAKTVKTFSPEDTLYFNPSSFSACKRSIYYKKRNVPSSNPITSVSYLKMDFGSTLHTRIQSIVNKLGILIEAEKLKTVKFQGLNFRYKVDGIIVLNGQRRIMEIKTTYAGGLRAVKYDPKPEDVIQMSLYMLFEHIAQGVLLYVGRDNAYMIEYYITQECDAYKAAIAEINRKIPELKALEIQIKNGLLPNRDCQIALKNKDGAISGKFQKDKTQYTSDWQCTYCQWHNLCWAEELDEIKNHSFYIEGEFK